MKPLMFLRILLVIAPLSLPAQAPPPPATFSLAPGDVTEAIINTSPPVRFTVMLTPLKSAVLTAFTGVNLNKQVRIVVADKVRSEPFLRQQMTGPSLELYVSSTEDALATVKALLTSKLSFDQLYTWTDPSGQTHYSDQPPVQSPEPPSPTGENNDARILLKGLQGSWDVTKATMNGKESRDPSVLQAHWIFQGNELVLRSPAKGTARFTLKFDTKAEPKAFHLTAIEPANSGAGWMLFARETNTLKIAFHDNLEGRPAGFEPLEPRAKPELVVVTLAPMK